MTPKLRLLSLSGALAVAHFSLFLVIEIYQQSFTGPDGSVHWTEENRPVLQFLSIAMIVHMFPIGWLSFLSNWLHPTEADIVLTVILVGANSAFVGYVLAWMIRTVRSSSCRIRASQPS